MSRQDKERKLKNNIYPGFPRPDKTKEQIQNEGDDKIGLHNN